MTIAITARGDGLDAEVDERFGRAPRFVLYDTETRRAFSVENHANMNAAQGAGIQAAESVSRAGAQCLLTGHCGPKAYRTLAAAGVRVFTGASGTVAQALAAYEGGRLKEATAADVGGHWT